MISLGEWFNQNVRRSAMILSALLIALCLMFMALYDFRSRVDLQRQISLTAQMLRIGVQDQNRFLAETALNEIHLLTKSYSTALCRDSLNILSVNAGFDSCDRRAKSEADIFLPGDVSYRVLTDTPVFAFDNHWLVTALLVSVLIFTVFQLVRRLQKSVRQDILEPILDFQKPTEIREIRNFREQQEAVLKLTEEKAAAKAMVEIAKQVAHDIRSPLSALAMIAGALKDLPEDKRVLIRNATQRINDIANDLLTKSKVAVNERAVANIDSEKELSGDEKSFVHIQSTVDQVVFEKRIQFQGNPGVRILSDFRNTGDVFVSANATELGRIISNLVNNSAEAAQQGEVSIVIALRAYESSVVLTVSDNGIGIPPHILQSLGQPGVSYGKRDSESGHGLGIFHAKRMCEQWGGKITLNTKLNLGTIVELHFERLEAPTWFARCLEIQPNSIVISLDDDPGVHEIWRQRFSAEDAKFFNVSVHGCDHPGRAAEMLIDDSAFFLIDFEFKRDQQSGLELIRQLKIESRAFLVTSRFEEKSIQRDCEKAGVKMLPKQFAASVPIKFLSSKSFHAPEAEPGISNSVGTTAAPPFQ